MVRVTHHQTFLLSCFGQLFLIEHPSSLNQELTLGCPKEATVVIKAQQMNEVSLSSEHPSHDLLVEIRDDPDTPTPTSELVFLERILRGVLLDDKALGRTSVVANIPQYKTAVSKVEVGQSPDK